MFCERYWRKKFGAFFFSLYFLQELLCKTLALVFIMVKTRKKFVL